MNDRTVSIYIAGDSTAANKEPSARPETGWGEKLGEFFGDGIVVENRAVNGRSSKSYIDQGGLEGIAGSIREGDYLFIQFGHNDEKIEDPLRYTSADGTYPEYLRRYLECARSRGAFPVLLTSVERRKFTSDGTIERTHAAYQDAMKRLAREEGVPLLDAGERTRELFERLGPGESKRLFLHLPPGVFSNYPDGKTDDTHFVEAGARTAAGLIAEEIRRVVPESLGKYLKNPRGVSPDGFRGILTP